MTLPPWATATRQSGRHGSPGALCITAGPSPVLRGPQASPRTNTPSCPWLLGPRAGRCDTCRAVVQLRHGSVGETQKRNLGDSDAHQARGVAVTPRSSPQAAAGSLPGGCSNSQGRTRPQPGSKGPSTRTILSCFSQATSREPGGQRSKLPVSGPWRLVQGFRVVLARTCRSMASHTSMLWF